MATKKSVKTAKKTVNQKARKKPIVKKVRKLSPKEKSFCENFLLTHNASKAAIDSGYSKKSARQIGHRLLTKDYILKEIERLSAIVTEKVLITTEDIVKDLMEVKDRCMEKVEITDKEGNHTGLFKFDSSGANKSLDRLGDYTGGFSKKMDHTSKGDKIEPTVLYMPDNGRT